MAIVNTVANTTQGFGSGFLTQRVGIALTSGTTFSLPSTGSVNGNPIYSGKMRIKIYNGGGTTPTLTALQLKATDGVNTVIFDDLNFSAAVTLSSTSFFDYIKDFNFDFSTLGGGATGTLLAPGTAVAMVFQAVATLGGSSPTASMDMEVCGQP